MRSRCTVPPCPASSRCSIHLHLLDVVADFLLFIYADMCSTLMVAYTCRFEQSRRLLHSVRHSQRLQVLDVHAVKYLLPKAERCRPSRVPQTPKLHLRVRAGGYVLPVTANTANTASTASTASTAAERWLLVRP